MLTAPQSDCQTGPGIPGLSSHIVSEVEMKDHKKYFNHDNLSKLLSQSGMITERHRYFQMGMNNYCVAMKTTPMYRKQ